MNNSLKQALEGLVPFVLLGIAVSLVIGLFIMFSYVLIWGLFIGGVLWLTSLIKNYFFPAKTDNSELGRIIEHKDID